jgi:hypothetical protein
MTSRCGLENTARSAIQPDFYRFTGKPCISQGVSAPEAMVAKAVSRGPSGVGHQSSNDRCRPAGGLLEGRVGFCRYGASRG